MNQEMPEELKEQMYETAMSLMNSGKWDQAHTLLLQASKVYEDTDIKKFLALCLHKTGKLEEAVSLYQELLKDGKSYDVLNNLAICYSSMARYDDAIRCLLDASIECPTTYTHFANLGHAFRMKRDFKTAISYFEKAIELEPNDSNLYVNLGGCYGELLEFDKAVEYLETAVEKDESHPAAHIDLGCAYLLQGKWKEGWQEYKWRFKHYPHLKKKADQFPPEKEFTGDFPVAEDRIKIYCEQGLGDIINFIRFVPLLEKTRANYFVEPPEDLADLLKYNGYPVEYSNDYHWHCSVFNLPLILGLTPEKIEELYQPYIKSSCVADFSAYADKFKIGIVWAGNPKHNRDPQRSCRLSHFRKLANLPNVQLFSFQKDIRPRHWHGVGTVDLMQYCGDMRIVDLKDHMTTWDSTASLLQEMDAVVTVDTSMLHLAGAMGKRTYALISYLPDFRWMLSYGNRTFYYPTVSLYRQPEDGNWEQPFDRIYNDLLQSLA